MKNTESPTSIPFEKNQWRKASVLIVNEEGRLVYAGAPKETGNSTQCLCWPHPASKSISINTGPSYDIEISSPIYSLRLDSDYPSLSPPKAVSSQSRLNHYKGTFFKSPSQNEIHEVPEEDFASDSDEIFSFSS